MKITNTQRELNRIARKAGREAAISQNAIAETRKYARAAAKKRNMSNGDRA